MSLPSVYVDAAATPNTTYEKALIEEVEQLKQEKKDWTTKAKNEDAISKLAETMAQLAMSVKKRTTTCTRIRHQQICSSTVYSKRLANLQRPARKVASIHSDISYTQRIM